MSKSKKPQEFHDGVCDYCEATQVKCCYERPCCCCSISPCSYKYPKREDPYAYCYACETPYCILDRRRKYDGKEETKP